MFSDHSCRRAEQRLGFYLNQATMRRTISQSVFFIVMFGELLRHFSSDPHFAIVPRSLAYAAKDIMFLLIVIMFMTLTFATMLGALYGSTLLEFSTMKGAILTVILMTLGEWSDPYYQILSVSEYPGLFTFVFVLYNVVVIIVTMNIFLSIVLDAYSVVKDFQAEEAALRERAQEDGRGSDVGNRATESKAESTLKPQRSMMMMVQELKARRGRKGVPGVNPVS